MTALSNRAGHYIFALWFLSSFLLLSFFSPNLSGRRLYVYHTSTHGVAYSTNLEFRSEMCCTQLAGNVGPKPPTVHHLGTISQFCRAISSQRRYVSIGKKLVKQQYLSHMSLQYGELWRTSGCNRFVSLRHPS